MECVGTVSGVVAAAGVNSVALSWTEPSGAEASGVEASAYFVRVVGEDRFVGVAAPATGVTVSGLRNGVEYGFVVVAANEDGSGVASSVVRATPTTGAEGEVAGLIVGFEAGVQVLDAQTDVPGEESVDQVGLTVAAEVIDGVHTVDLSEPVSITQARQIAADLASDPAVAWAEPDQFVFAAATDDAFPNAPPNDEQYAPSQWNLWDTYGIGVGEGADEMTQALVANQGSGTTIAVIDTGIAPHGDLDEQLVAGYDFVSDPQALAAVRSAGGAVEPFDADSADESFYGARGWDANPADPGDWRGVAPVRDSSWHGTKIAGVIAAQADNDQGIIGVTPQAKVQPIRALSWRGGLLSDIAASITWASGGAVDGVAVNETPADVINMSFAVESVCSVALQGAIDAAFARGSVLVAAAGNANDDVAKYAPANCENVISVGATGRDGLRAAYSNYGPGVDISAPGGAITGDGGVVTTSNTGLTTPADPSTATTEGTSVAAAHVSAAAAFITAWQPAMTAVDIRSLIIGPDSVRPFAADTCDTDPAKECGNGILNLAQIASAGEPGVDMSLATGGSLIADGSTVAYNSTVTVGTAGLLSPGSGYRELRTSLDTRTQYRSGTAVAPEGWAVQYSTNNGSSWVSSEPSPATAVTDVRATATTAAGLIEGTSQIYSSETTASIPSMSFSASSGGDGWGITHYDDYIFNVFHHTNVVRLACHVKSTGSRCAGFSSGYVEFSGYQAAMRSDVAMDQESGKLYVFTAQVSGTYAGRPGVLCLDVAAIATSAPTACGFTPLSTDTSVTNYGYLSDAVTVGRRIFGVETAGANFLLCFDAATGVQCPNSPVAVDGASGDSWGRGGGRPIVIGDRILVRTSSKIYCFIASDLTQECANSSNWPVTITSNTSDPQFAVHADTNGNLDGICSLNQCFDLNGVSQSWVNPFTLGTGGNQWAYTGVTTMGKFYWSVSNVMKCFDFSTNAACSGFNSPSWGQLYFVDADPQNPGCLWTNSDEGAIKIVDATTGATNCSGNPVITLQPSEFAPRYACSTSSGITEWTQLRLVSLAGGGTASSVALTVRNAAGATISSDWTSRAVTLGTPLDMTGLSPTLSGSRPTFSFSFAGVTGTISNAVIALDYKGKGPELCVDVTATSGSAVRADVSGRLTERVGAEETFSASRYFNIGAATSTVVQTVPGVPRSLTGTGLNTTATLTFLPPLSDGGATITEYQGSIDGGSSWTPLTLVQNSDGSLSTTITGLTPGVTYSVQIAAVNSVGRGASASGSVVAQLISISTLLDTPVNQGPITLAATTSGGLPLTYTASPSSVCTAGGTGGRTITLVAEGTCSLVAYQAGDSSASPVILPAETPGSFTVLAAYYEPTEPGVPTGLTLVPGSGQISLSWTAPVDTGYTSLTDYSIQYKASTSSSWIPFIDGVSTGTTAIITGLTNGTTYNVRVAAVNSVGTGAYTATSSAVPATIPGAPTSLSATKSGTSATLTWTAPASTGGSAITDYRVEYKLSTDATWTTFTDSVTSTTGATVTGLNSADAYDFQVTTINAVGSSTSTSTVNLTATAGAGQVSLSWVAPSSPGGTITDYEMQYRESGTSSWTTFTDAVSTTTGGVVTGLSNGTVYNFRVATIINSTTVSSYTSVVSATPRTTPDAPSINTLPGNRQVTLVWSAPANGGAAITDYVIQYKASTDSSWTTVTDGTTASVGGTVTGLLNGTSYDFKVASVNAVGTSSYSTDVSGTPRTTPGAPTAVTATATSGQVSLTWTAPVSNGGAAITNYAVEYKTSSALTWLTATRTASTTTSQVVTGLVDGTVYNFRIAAINVAGTGSYATTVSAQYTTPPGAVRSLAGSIAGDDLTLTWLAPASDGGAAISDYRVEYRLTTASSWTVFTDGTSATTGAVITGLTELENGLSFDVRVTAINTNGDGPSVTGTFPEPASPTTSSPVVVTTPVIEPVLPSEPVEVELTFTEDGVLLINGVPVSLDITPSPGGGSWEVKGPDFSLSFTPQVTSSGALTGPGAPLSAPAGGWITVTGDGYKGSTKVKAYLIPRPSIARSLPRATGPIYLGEVEVLPDGTFDIRLTLPADINQGNYVLQINGLSPASSVRSVNMALGVTAPESIAEAAARKMAKKAFFQPRSARFTETGLKRLRTIQASIPDGAQDVVVSVTGVSVSMADLRSNLLLAGKRAERIVKYLQARDVEGQYNVTVNTSVKFGSADRLTQNAKRSTKPLTTVEVTFTAAS